MDASTTSRGVINYVPERDEYPNVLTSCCGPTLLVFDFEIGDHNFTVPSADADKSCWWFPPKYERLQTASVWPDNVAANTLGSKHSWEIMTN